MTLRDEWDSVLDGLSRHDLAKLKLVACAMHRRCYQLPPRLRRFFVFTGAPPPLIIGCRRALNVLPHPPRRASDLPLARPAFAMSLVNISTQPIVMLISAALSLLAVYYGGIVYVAMSFAIGALLGTVFSLMQVNDLR